MQAPIDRELNIQEKQPNKLPEITAAFWIMKIAATTFGETGGDWLSMTMQVGYLTSSLIFFAFFLATLTGQLAAKRHYPLLYWSVIIATSTAGTTISDYMDRTLKLGYANGTAILVTILILMLSIWKISVGNVSVDRIRSRKVEIFYWMTILFSNTLGTALGDFLSDESGFGFFGSWLSITGLLTCILAAYKWTPVNRVALFWLAFVLTRPFGATFGDVLTKKQEQGGYDLGTGHASLIILGILLVTMYVSYVRAARSGSDIHDQPVALNK